LLATTNMEGTDEEKIAKFNDILGTYLP